MFLSLIYERVRRHYAWVVFACMLMLVPLPAVQAQGGVGSSRGLPSSSSGNNIIQGRLLFPLEPKGGKRLKVRLTSTDSLDQTTSTDGDGLFLFNGLPDGHFTITVDGGTEFDSAVEPVSIDREASPGQRNMNISIILRPKGSAAALNKIPKAARELYAKGLASATKGDGKKAIEQFDGAIAIYPEFAQAHDSAGVQYLKLGQPDKAAESFQAALKLAPDELGTRLNYGIALLQMKKFAEAETTLREVLNKNESLSTAHMYLGISLMSQQKFDESEKELLRAVALNNTEAAVAHRYLGGIYWRNKDYQRAADELETYLKLVPKAADADRTLAAIKELRSKK